MRLAGIALACVLLPANPELCHAQAFGQWWWNAVLGTNQATLENHRGGQRLSRYEEQGVSLALDLYGYVVHPRIAEFRLGGSARLTDIDGRRALDTDRFDYSLDLDLVPKSKLPISVFARHELYEYGLAEGQDPAALLREPESGTSYGGSFLFRKGRLRGTGFDIQRRDVTYLDPDADRGRFDRVGFRWYRNAGGFQNRLRIRHSLNDYGIRDYEVERLVADFDQQGSLPGDWHWLLSLNGTDNRSRFSGAGEQINKDLRLRTQLSRPVRSRDRFLLFTEAGSFALDPGVSFNIYRVGASQQVNLGHAWQLRPFIRFSGQTGGPISRRTPEAGIAATWTSIAEGPWAGQFAAGTSYARDDRKDSSISTSGSRGSWSLSGSISHRGAAGFSKRLEAQLARNELREADPGLDGPLDPVTRPRGLSVQDLMRVRMALSRNHRSRSSGLWLQWQTDESAGDTTSRDSRSETLSGSVHGSRGRFQIRANASSTTLRQTGSSTQEVESLGGIASWKPWRYLNLAAQYRSDRRRVVFGPDVDGRRLELTATLRIGWLNAKIRTWENRREPEGTPVQINRGISWSISRRFAGLLPIISAPQRRGTIR